MTRRAHRALEAAELAAGSLLIAAILVLVVIQAAQRHLPVQGWVWSGELARYALVWVTFVLAGHLTGRGEHIGLEVIDYVVKGRALTAVQRFADAVVAAVALGFAVDAWNLAGASLGRTSPAMGIPLVWLYVAAVAGFALTAVRAGLATVVGRPERAADADADGAGDDTELTHPGVAGHAPHAAGHAPGDGTEAAR